MTSAMRLLRAGREVLQARISERLEAEVFIGRKLREFVGFQNFTICRRAPVTLREAGFAEFRAAEAFSSRTSILGCTPLIPENEANFSIR